MSDRRGHLPARGWVAVSTLALAALLFVACGGSSNYGANAPTTTAPNTVTSTTLAALPDVAPTAASFVNLSRMSPVGDHFVASLNGHLDAALAVARSKQGGVYPVGTLIQLFPAEAMVKRHKGYSPSTRDWEFFSLSVSPEGTKIKSSGAQVKNFLGGDCSACHSLAKPQFDFVCEKSHGCAPLGVTDAFIATIQKADPRPKQ
jgi:hypothetical protein